jgi:hypothetical protein
MSLTIYKPLTFDGQTVLVPVEREAVATTEQQGESK